jgi:DNA repair exonuclease SbcCD ATPase subunit
MRILSCHVSDFASYRELFFDFQKQGLTLIQGPNGSGKSTFCDIVPWVLFGRTAKDGAVDEVINWNTNKPVYGAVRVQKQQDEFRVVRTRGKYAKDNDLFLEEDGKITRGKDLIDTQRIINARLGTDFSLYCASAYFHEFSQTAGFFTAPAKLRRQLCEQIADLTLAKSLMQTISTAYKATEAKFNKNEQELATIESVIQTIKKNLAAAELQNTKAAEQFERSRQEKMNEIQQLEVSLEELVHDIEEKMDVLQAKLKKVSTQTCETCGQIRISTEYQGITAELRETEKAYNREMIKLKQQNQRYYEEKKRSNPFSSAPGAVETMNEDLVIAETKRQALEADQEGIATQLVDQELLLEILANFRSQCIITTIARVQNKTNALLADYFDGEIQVKLEVTGEDKLDVEITKDGNICAYTQLSKGQRQMLKLCFSTSVMLAAAEHNGLDLNFLIFDEALDGLADDNKLKAHRLLESLTNQYESVFVVDHSEALKLQFSNQYTTKLVNGSSVLCQS